jgi:hypothetical protein
MDVSTSILPALPRPCSQRPSAQRPINLSPSSHPHTHPMSPTATVTKTQRSTGGDVKSYYTAKIEASELSINKKTQNLRRLEAQRNALNARGESRTHFYMLEDEKSIVCRRSNRVEAGQIETKAGIVIASSPRWHMPPRPWSRV